MFSKVAIIVSAFAVGAMADVNQCNTANTQCCNSVQKASAPSAVKALGIVNAVVQDVNALVGLGCTPVSVLTIAGNSCSSQPVCCTNNNFNGVVALGCDPINANL